MYNTHTDSPFSHDIPFQQAPSTSGARDSFVPEDFALLMARDPEEQVNPPVLESWPTSPEEISSGQTSVSEMFSPFTSQFSNPSMNPQVSHDYFSLPGAYQQQHTQPDINDYVDEPLFSSSATNVADFEPPPVTGPIRRRSDNSNHSNRMNQLRPRTKRLSQSHIGNSTLHQTPEPQLLPPSSSPASSSSTRRQAHNLVERKYRDTLNAELERLRRTIPHIRDLESETPDGRPRPSKATVLAAATEYIKKLELDVEDLRDENMRLREEAGLTVVQSGRKRGSA